MIHNQTTSQPLPREEEERLAAVMFTDIVGYSKMMHLHQALMLELREEHYSILRRIFSEHGGREIETTGDGFLVVFESAIQAGQAAMKIQTTLHERNASEPAERHVQARIGLHLGGVIFKDGKISGDTVNIANRVLTQARPGGICMTEDFVHQVLYRIKNINVIILGKVRLKNIATPMTLCRVVMPWEKSVSERQERWAFYAQGHQKQLITTVLLLVLVGAAGWLSWGILFPPRTQFVFKEKPRIAVLPFKLVGASNEYEFLSEGFARTVNRELRDIPHLTVISNTSAFAFEKASLTVKEIADTLHVQYVLSGTISSTANVITIVAQLFDHGKDTVNWSGDYPLQRNEVLIAQQDILKNICERLHRDYTPNTQFQHANERGAFLPYLLGNYYVHKSNARKIDNESAIHNFSDAIKKDTTFIEAFASLGEAQMYHHLAGWDTTRVLVTEARKNALKALQLHPGNSLALTVLGSIHDAEGEKDSAALYFEKAIAIDDNNIVAITDLANMNSTTMPGVAADLYKKAILIEPLIAILHSNLGTVQAMQHQYDEANSSFEKAVRLDSSYADGWSNLGYFSQIKSDYSNSVLYCVKAIQKGSSRMDVYETLVASAIAGKKFSVAESVLRHAIETMSDNFDLYYLLGQTLLFDGQKANANNYFSQGLELLKREMRRDTANAELFVQAGLFYARLSKPAEALSASTRAGELGQDQPTVAAKLANIYALLNRKNDVYHWFEIAKKLSSSDYDLNYLKTAWDMGTYRDDPEIQFIAKEQASP